MPFDTQKIFEQFDRPRPKPLPRTRMNPSSAEAVFIELGAQIQDQLRAAARGEDPSQKSDGSMTQPPVSNTSEE